MTPGQIAHDAGKFDRKWSHMGESQQADWERIAQAVIDAQQVAVPDAAIIKEIERAIVDHCTGGDLWMSASLGKDRIKRLMAPQGGKT